MMNAFGSTTGVRERDAPSPTGTAAPSAGAVAGADKSCWTGAVIGAASVGIEGAVITELLS